jgi:hypothetical protein
MKIKKFNNQNAYIADRFGNEFKLLGVIYDNMETFVAYEDPRTDQRYIERLKTKYTDNTIIQEYELEFIEDEALANQLINIAIKEGILTPVLYQIDKAKND